MTARHLLNGLRERGLRIVADGHDLEVRGPKWAVTPAVLAAIRNQKADLLAVLAAEREAQALVENLIARGSTFEVIRVQGNDSVIWFGPQGSVPAETKARIARLSPEIITVLKRIRRWSSRTRDEKSA